MKSIQTPSTAVVPAQRRCPRCGTPLGGFGPEGLCGACLFDSGLAADEPAAELDLLSSGSRRFGDYELLEEIARGGMGVIFKARQISLNRIVAVKMILRGEFAGVAELARFRAEAETAARLQHPNIVAIHEVGEREGLPYFSMDYVEGQNLAQLVGNTPLPAKRAAKYLKAITEAVEYAHQQGILHRDLKPSNVLVDASDQPRVTDFGLAKRLASTSDSGLGTPDLTLTGQVLGSPNFMPPEQAAGKNDAIGPASDVYSLGAILYHALTGRPPFVAESVTATLRLVAESEPVTPRLLNGSVPRDLETICVKCLQKEPHRRYGSSQELGDELGRFLRDEPIHAHPVAPAEKAWRWCRRNRALASAGAAILVLLLTLAIGSPIAAFRIDRERQQAQRAERTAKQQEQLARDSAVEARQQQGIASEQKSLALRRFYAAQMNLAMRAWEAGESPRTLDLLETQRPRAGQEDLRGFEWFHLWRLCNGQLVRTIRTRAGTVWGVAFSPDGTTLAACADGTIWLWDTATGHERFVLKPETESVVAAVAFTPDGKTLISGGWDKLVRLWDVDTGKLRATLPIQPGWVRCLAVSPDGVTLASGGDVGEVTLWDLATGRERAKLKGHQSVLSSLAFSPDNTTLASGSGWGDDGGVLNLWTLTNGLAQSKVKIAEHSLSVAFSPDGKTLAATMFDEIHLWDANGKLQSTLKGHLQKVTSVAFLPDGKALVSCGVDRTVRLWQLPIGHQTNVESRVIGVQLKDATCLSVSGDGTMLASGVTDGSVKLWNLSKTHQPAGSQVAAEFKFGDDPQAWDDLLSVLPSPDSRKVFIVTKHGTEMRDLASGLRENFWPQMSGWGVLSPDGKLMATARKVEDGLVMLWDLADGHLRASVQAHPDGGSTGRYISMAFSPDGRILATGSPTFEGQFGDTLVRLWDAAGSLTPLRTFEAPPPNAGISALGFSPDGRTVAAALRHSRVLLVDASTGQAEQILTLENGTVDVLATVFSWDGRFLATPGGNGIVKLWDVQTGNLHTALHGHASSVNSVSFSPDGGTIATGSSDATVRLWDVATGQERITLKGRSGYVTAVAFSPDGDTLIAGYVDGFVKLWRGGRVPQAEVGVALEAEARGAEAQDYNALAWTLATDPDSKRRDGSRAVKFAEEAAAAIKRKDPNILDTLAAAYAEAGQFEKAVSVQQEAIRLLQKEEAKADLGSRLKLYAARFPYRDCNKLAQMSSELLAQGKFAEAEPLARECLALREKQSPDDWRTFSSRSVLGGCLLGQKKYAVSEPLLLSGYDGLKEREAWIAPIGKPRLKEAIQRLVQLFEETSRPTQAGEWKKKLANFDNAGK